MARKSVQQMTDAEINREVTALRNAERAARKSRKPFPSEKMLRITTLALEQGTRWAQAQGWE